MSETNSDRSTAELLLAECVRFVEPLADAADDGVEGLIDFGRSAGIDLDTVLVDSGELEPLTNAVSESYRTLEPVLSDEEAADVESLLDAIEATFAAIDSFGDLAVREGVAIDPVDLRETLFAYLVTRYLRSYHPTLRPFLVLFGIVGVDRDDDLDRPRLDELDDIVADPNADLVARYDWGEPEFEGSLLLSHLAEVLWSLNVPATYDHHSDADVATLTGRSDDTPSVERLWVPIFLLESPTGRTSAGIYFMQVPSGDGHDAPGIAVVPYGLASASDTIPLGEGWQFGWDVSGEVAEFGLVVRESGADLESVGDSTVPAELHASAEIVRTIDSSESATLLGDPGGTRIAVRSVAAEAGVEYDGSEAVFVVGFPASGTLAIDPDDLGGFLSKVLPADGIDYDFDVTVGWASDGGLYLDNGGTLEASLPQNASVGPITLDEIYLGVTPAAEDADLRVVGATSATVELGPVTGSVRRTGVSADVNFVGGSDGNFGPVDVDLGFEPPSGIAVSIDSGGVTGGGFLRFEPERGRYSGGLQLQVADISINAVGLLTTELPGGEDGFSLLVLITAQDLGIQLGMGLTLEGIGGLVGVHRSMQPEPLAEAVRTGTLDSVLFPTDVVANAQRIVSDLRAIFPPTKGEHVVGPMVKLGWGSPTLIEADLGIVLQIPTVKIAILGRVSTQLPDEEAPIVVLNMEALGLILPEEQRASMEAHLFDSRVAVFTLTGRMAMVSRWGDDPAFILTVGGFHPAFDPPDDVPHVDRLAISLSKGSNFKFEVRGYFAVTSNTLQTGAHVEVFVGKGKWGVRGFLGFDALFRWDPEFKFVADFEAGVEITPIGLSLTVEGHLEGPGPWHVRGKVKFSLVFVTVEISVSATIGEEAGPESLPTAKVMPELSEAVVDPANWDAQRPGGTTAIATFRELDPGDDRVLAHPLGRLAVRQTVVPLSQDGRDVVIDTFGNARPGDYRQFRIEHAGGGFAKAGRDETVRDHFAPAQFLELSDSERLERESFERLPAGRALGPTRAHVPEGSDFTTATRRTTLDYETSVVDEMEDNYRTPLFELGELAGARPEVARLGLPPREVRAQLEIGSVATAPSRTDGGAAYRPRPELEGPGPVDEPVADPGADLSGTISVRDSGYTVARTDALERADIADAPERVTRVEAEQAFERHVAETPGAADDLHVTGEHHVASDGGAGP